MDLTQFIAAGGIVGLFGAAAVVLFRSMSYEGMIAGRFQGQIDDLTKDLDSVKEDNLKCQKANHILITTLQKNGMEVPSEAWL